MHVYVYIGTEEHRGPKIITREFPWFFWIFFFYSELGTRWMGRPETAGL